MLANDEQVEDSSWPTVEEKLSLSPFPAFSRKLQKGMDPPGKAQRMADYVKNMQYEVGVIAHSCGVRYPRGLRRFHARVVQPNGLTISLAGQFPGPNGAAG